MTDSVSAQLAEEKARQQENGFEPGPVGGARSGNSMADFWSPLVPGRLGWVVRPMAEDG